MKRYELTSGELLEKEDGSLVKYKSVERIKKLGFGRTHCALCGADLSMGNHSPSCRLVERDIGLREKLGRLLRAGNAMAVCIWRGVSYYSEMERAKNEWEEAYKEWTISEILEGRP